MVGGDRCQRRCGRWPAWTWCSHCTAWERRIRDGWACQNGCFFGKVPNGLWPPAPPPRFRKIILQIFSRIHDQSTVYNGKNLQYKFLDWKWPPPLLELFRKNIRFGGFIRPKARECRVCTLASLQDSQLIFCDHLVAIWSMLNGEVEEEWKQTIKKHLAKVGDLFVTGNPLPQKGFIAIFEKLL